MLANLAVASGMVSLTVVIHLLGLAGLLAAFNHRNERIGGTGDPLRQMGVITIVVFGVFAIHTLQIWLYAAVYLAVGEFSTLEAALYFSTSTFTTVGFGDVYLDESWRLLSAIESANGFILIGWSTAFLVNVTFRLRAVEEEWARRREAVRDAGEND